MRYRCEIEINLPREEMIAKLDNAENMYKWQKGLISHEFLEGEPGAEGSTMKLNYQMGKRKVEMVEKITKRQLPDLMEMQYDAKGVHNVVGNQFIDLGNGKTKWVTDNYFKMKGMMKVFAVLMPGAFKKQSMKYLQDFKNFAENGVSVNEK